MATNDHGALPQSGAGQLAGPERFIPERGPRPLTALCLSGGGFRAALFHLGGATRLNELGILSTIDTVSAVSGGSIFAAHLQERVRPWPARGEVFKDWENLVARPFREFVANDLRTAAIVRRFTSFSPGAAADVLASRYTRLSPRALSELPETPSFVFSATDLAFGVNWIFERTRMGDYQAGHMEPPDWTVARAVAASSCFPPVFDPVPIGIAPEKLTGGNVPKSTERDRLIRGLRLTDGGVYDNMGLEPVWKTHGTLFVSDGGATFDFTAQQAGIQRLLRYSTVIGNQVSSVRKRWLMSNYQLAHRTTDNVDIERTRGCYWGVGSAASKYPIAGGQARLGYAAQLVSSHIAEVRTDMDAFSPAEIQILENHGYLLADAAVQTYARESAPLPDAATRIPWEKWGPDRGPEVVGQIMEALGQSKKRRLRVGPLSMPLP
jgi:NTE family protein